jgi:type IV pilus assembly protein PilY1
MLHAFSGETGEELFAYLPEFLASSAADQGYHHLTDPDYQHRYYVDLSPVVSDVYMAGAGGALEDWRTILIGGARTGGKGIFALDVTDPGSFATSPTVIPLWEFTSEDDPRMGYITEPPTVGLARWGKQDSDIKWTAFVPNGYNSSTQSTGVFMLNLEGGLDGDWSDAGDYRYIEFEDAGDGATGLSPIRQLDLDGDRVIDRIYAGDLKGNIWSAQYFATGANGGSIAVSNGGNPLFTAEYDQSGVSKAQPITVAPMVIRNPDKDSGNNPPDLMVLFGTGQYLTQVDPVDPSVQSFYGVLDTGTGELDRSDLEGRDLTESTTTGEDGVEYKTREASGDELGSAKGWYVDFDDEPGERINQSAQVRGDYVFVNSIVPTDNPCDIGGDGWIMAFGLDGQSPDRAVWPKLGTGIVGYKTTGGLPNQGSFLGDYVLIPRSDSEILSDEVDVGRKTGGLGRVGWQELYN